MIALLVNPNNPNAERVILSYADSLVTTIIRPATVCGVSPRMRLDLTVNLLTMQASVPLAGAGTYGLSAELVGRGKDPAFTLKGSPGGP